MDNNIDHLIDFINKNLQNLLQIYIKERLNNGDGFLNIKGDKLNNKVDVYYIKLELADEILIKKIQELNYTKSKAYFFVYDVSNLNINSIIEKELDTKIS